METANLAEPQSTYGASGMSLLELLERHFGYKSFRPLQQEVIEHVINGNDAVVLMPTPLTRLNGRWLNCRAKVLSACSSYCTDAAVKTAACRAR